jgi:hypothetical protein
MISAGDLLILLNNVRDLGHRHKIPLAGVRGGAVVGAFTNTPHNELEFIAHEAAHLLVAGVPVKRFPKNIPQYIDSRGKRLSPRTSDSQEVDAAIVTFLTLKALGVYEGDVQPLAASAYRNMQHGLLKTKREEVLQEIEHRLLWDGAWYRQHADALVVWLRGS